MDDYKYYEYSIEKQSTGANGIPSLYFHCALSCISVARANRSKADYKNKAKKFLKRIKTWTKKGNPNTQHMEELIEAELASGDANKSVATKHYEVAVLLAGRWGLVNDRALAHERFGDHCMRQGDEENAKYHYSSALGLCKEWGAHAVAEKLNAQWLGLLVPVADVQVDNRGVSDADGKSVGTSTLSASGPNSSRHL